MFDNFRLEMIELPEATPRVPMAAQAHPCFYFMGTRERIPPGIGSRRCSPADARMALCSLS